MTNDSPVIFGSTRMVLPRFVATVVLTAFAVAIPACAADSESSDSDVPVADGGSDAEDNGDTGALGRGRTSLEDEVLSPGLVPSDSGMLATDAKGPTGLINLRQSCAIRAERQCARLQECSEFFLRMVFGKSDVCLARLTASCLAEASLPDTNVTTFSIVRCTQELNDQSCANIVDQREPDSCRPLGERKEDKGCGSDLQCATGYCERGNKGCGTCKLKRVGGQACSSDGACMAGLHCGLNGKCVRKGGLGNPCGEPSQECGVLLSCLQGKCVAPLPLNAACISTNDCQRSAGQVCSSDPGLRAFMQPPALCRASVLAAVNDVCRQGDNLIAYCPSGPANCLPDTQGTYRCVVPAKEGDACGDKAMGRACSLPAACVDGACRLGPVGTCAS